MPKDIFRQVLKQVSSEMGFYIEEIFDSPDESDFPARCKDCWYKCDTLDNCLFPHKDIKMIRQLPIIFCAEMAKAADEGRKTHTRRIEALTRLHDDFLFWQFFQWDFGGFAVFNNVRSGATLRIKPHYQVGDLLWVKERLREAEYQGSHGWIAYQSDDIVIPGTSCEWSWQRGLLPARFMPKKYARLWLRVTAVKEPHRIQMISEEDAKAEGTLYQAYPEEEMTLANFASSKKLRPLPLGYWYFESRMIKGLAFGNAKAAFADFWDTLHPKPGERFEDNPYVFEYEFQLIKRLK